MSSLEQSRCGLLSGHSEIEVGIFSAALDAGFFRERAGHRGFGLQRDRSAHLLPELPTNLMLFLTRNACYTSPIDKPSGHYASE
jgi:hypothetical protein